MESQWPAVISGAVFALFLAFAVILPIFNKIRAIQWKKNEDEYRADQDRRDADKLQKALDHQLNHGRRIFNWLKRELSEYEVIGIKLSKMEDNGGSFMISIDREASHLFGSDPILQIKFDFASKHAEDNYKGHIHYGAYGADILFLVLDHAPQWSLDRLVLKVVHEEVQRIEALAK